MKNTPLQFLSAIVLLGNVIGTAMADGGTVRLSERRGDLQITVFTSPTPLRVGPIDVSVLVQDVRRGRPLAGVAVLVKARPMDHPDRMILQPATTDAAANKIFHSARFDLSEPGTWQMDVQIDGGSGIEHLSFDVEAAPPWPSWVAMTGWLAWPLIPIVLFGVHVIRVRRSAHALARVKNAAD